MSAEQLPPGNYREWLNRARSSLIRSKQQVQVVYLEDLCFDAQQATEKALKALLISKGVRPPRSHDISGLITLVENTAIAVPKEILSAATLSEYAVESRYPGLAEPVTQQEYQEAMSTAEAVVNWVSSLLEKK